MATATKTNKNKGSKGQHITKPDNDNENNPLLHIQNKCNFKIETNNLLEEPSALIYEGYDDFDLKKEKEHFDIEKLKSNSTIVVVLRYYEYLCIATFTFSYITPMLESGMKMRDVFEMIKHSLKTKLLINVPSFDTVFEPELVYTGKVKY